VTGRGATAGRDPRDDDLEDWAGDDGDGDVASEADPAPFDAPLYWPGLSAERVAIEWESLRSWVRVLAERFAFDFRTLPACWYRHNALVEALVALRDFERACFAEGAPLSAGLDWQRALREIEARLRDLTSRTGCLSRHVDQRELPSSEPAGAWTALVTRDVTARRDRAVAAALGDGPC